MAYQETLPRIRVSRKAMMKRVARFSKLKGFDGGLPDSKMPGCERILSLAYGLARAEGRTRLACATKANIMKATEGMMKRVFEHLAPEHPEIASSHLIIDNCAHQLVIAPEQFDVIVATNMNGDILSDLAAGLVGGLGVAPSSNIGDDAAMFEAVHGTAPDIAGKDLANPTAMILSAIMMLRYIGEAQAAARIEAALSDVLADRACVTPDLGGEAGTRGMADALVARLLAGR